MFHRELVEEYILLAFVANIDVEVTVFANRLKRSRQYLGARSRLHLLHPGIGSHIIELVVEQDPVQVGLGFGIVIGAAGV